MDTRMVEIPAGIKVFGLVFKYPLAACAVLGSMAGSAVMTAYAEGKTWKVWGVHALLSLALTPLVIRLLDQEPAPDVFLGFAAIIAAVSHVGIRLISDRRIHDALAKRAANEIEHRGETK